MFSKSLINPREKPKSFASILKKKSCSKKSQEELSEDEAHNEKIYQKTMPHQEKDKKLNDSGSSDSSCNEKKFYRCGCLQSECGHKKYHDYLSILRLKRLAKKNKNQVSKEDSSDEELKMLSNLKENNPNQTNIKSDFLVPCQISGQFSQLSLETPKKQCIQLSQIKQINESSAYNSSSQRKEKLDIVINVGGITYVKEYHSKEEADAALRIMEDFFENENS